MSEFRIIDFMGYTAPTPSGKAPVVPSAEERGLAPGRYCNLIWADDSPPQARRIDVVKVQRICDELPWGINALFDTEYLIARLAVNRGVGIGYAPAPDRLAAQLEIVRMVEAIRSRPRGRAARIMLYHNTQGSFRPDNGAKWVQAWRDTNEVTMLEPVPGAPNGIASLFDCALGRLYRDYADPVLTAAIFGGIGDELKRLYPGMPRIGMLQPRKTGASFGPERFDYQSKEQFAGALASTTGKFDELALWNSGHYGPEGWTNRQSGTMYALMPGTVNTIAGDEWVEGYGWWSATKEYMRERQDVRTPSLVEART
ncbi:MAG: hypothetical protein KF805_08365 [Phycisphaeraceae bacterium]|nr:hypothetical protein [Phycisphaeraceae bacterium]